MADIYLRPLRPDDIDRIYQWHNSEELYRSLESPFRPVSRLAVQEWLNARLAFSLQEVNLAICSTSDFQHIGNIYLRDVDWIARSAELHIFIGNGQHRGKGYGAAAVRCILKYAFRDLGLNKVHLRVLEENIVALNIYQKCGFVVEGVLRNHVFKNGLFKNVVAMGLLAEEAHLPEEAASISAAFERNPANHPSP